MAYDITHPFIIASGATPIYPELCEGSIILDGEHRLGKPILSLITTSVTLTNIVFKNGASTGPGGAMLVKDSTVTLTSCSLQHNRASEAPPPPVPMGSGGGGAVALEGLGSFSAVSCQFVNNTAPYTGGAISIRITPSSALSMGSVKFQSCKFTNNSAAEGGAIYLEGALSL
jgi:predicted outer membrane repeat protein